MNERRKKSFKSFTSVYQDFDAWQLEKSFNSSIEESFVTSPA